MKRKIIIFLSVVAVLFGIYCTGIYVINNVFHAYHGKITLKVVDNDGHIVTNANVAVYFANQLFRNRECYKGVTDEKGCFSAKGMSQGDILYQITKKGYYKTENSYWFTKDGTTERDKLRPWMTKYTPWNPNLEITLREIRNPIPMYYKNVYTKIPFLNKSIGFDFEIGDWIEPYGKGKFSDVCFKLFNKRDSIHVYHKKLIISFPSKNDGVCLDAKSKNSAFETLYLAPKTSFSGSNIVFETIRNQTNIFVEAKSDNNFYIIFKTKSQLNEPLKDNFSNYSIISTPIEYGFGNSLQNIKFSYYFNPTPNDRNLEWNGSNLFDNTQWECHPSRESGRLKRKGK